MDAVAENDRVVVWRNRSHIYPYNVVRNSQFALSDGCLHAADCVGARYGEAVPLRGKGDRRAILLRMTAELNARTLSCLTQIVYEKDWGVICSSLQLKRGTVVVEAGFGSGSLTAVLSRAVGSSGAVYTYELDSERFLNARQVLADMKLGNVQVSNRDVYSAGFATDDLPSSRCADAVFLDLPEPWHAVRHAHAVLAPGGRLCALTPCVEQAVQLQKALLQHGFCEATCVETESREWHVFKLKPRSAPPSGDAPRASPVACSPCPNMGHTGYLISAVKERVTADAALADPLDLAVKGALCG